MKNQHWCYGYERWSSNDKEWHCTPLDVPQSIWFGVDDLLAVEKHARFNKDVLQAVIEHFIAYSMVTKTKSEHYQQGRSKVFE